MHADALSAMKLHMRTGVGRLCCSSLHDFLPDPETLGRLLAGGRGRKVMTTRSEMVRAGAHRPRGTAGPGQGTCIAASALHGDGRCAFFVRTITEQRRGSLWGNRTGTDTKVGVTV